MKSFSSRERELILGQLDHSQYDLVIIGGGITGAGAARDAVSRGMKVLLVEARDFASGTSSKSSKLIHGGIRYLENFEFKLVFEALSERTKLFELAPHLVHPLRFMIPLYKESRVGMFKMGLGMWAYDALSLFQAPEMHERLSADQSLQRMPMLRNQHLEGSYVYSDAYMDDDRLVLETLRSAQEMGLRAINYAEVVRPRFNEDGKIEALIVRDTFSGKEKTVFAKHFVSSVGPWTDILGEGFLKDWKKVLRPTKGIHITIAKERLPLSSAVVMGAEKGNRIVFGIPRHEMVIIGTTDTDFTGDPANVQTTSDDVKYLLSVAEQYFPGARLNESDIMASYAGVRPLVHDGSENEGKTSREHLIWTLPERNITFVAGGKYTTYRLMARQIIDEALNFFDIEDRVRFSRPQTELPLLPEATSDHLRQSLAIAPDLAKSFARPGAEVETLCQRYAMEAQSILARNPPHFTYWQLEASQAIDYTMCLSLVDFYARRAPLFLARADHGLLFLAEVAEIFQEKLGWSSQKTEDEKRSLQKYVDREMAWKTLPGASTGPFGPG